MSRLVLRIWLPDRPGALGAVASRVGAVKADVVGIDVIERDGGVAIDEIVVDLPDDSLTDLMLAEIRQVDGVGVEEVHRDPTAAEDPAVAALGAARFFIEAPDVATLAAAVADHARNLVGADWSCLLRRAEGDDAAEVLGGSGAIPQAAWLVAFRAGLLSDAVIAETAGPLDPVCLPLPAAGADLLLGRQSRPVRGRERERLLGLVAVADSWWTQLAMQEARRSHPSGATRIIA
ncbi:MAG TPA: ACT domain-containing protein [Acidimicrobiales bacterium]|nr:ACT domain-containing protein [Acidimicrobiales bacterium]